MGTVPKYCSYNGNLYHVEIGVNPFTGKESRQYFRHGKLNLPGATMPKDAIFVVPSSWKKVIRALDSQVDS